MTALELIHAVEEAGGSLSLRGDKIHCIVPEDAASLIDAIRSRREAVIDVLRQREPVFRCAQCGTRFDTRIGLARHTGYGCDYVPAEPEPARPLPSCEVCGSYAIYIERDGRKTCETCGAKRK